MVNGFVSETQRSETHLLQWRNGHPVGNGSRVKGQVDQNRIAMAAFRCPECGWVEFYADERYEAVPSPEIASAPEEVKSRYIRKSKAASKRLLSEDHRTFFVLLFSIPVGLISYAASGRSWIITGIAVTVAFVLGWKVGTPEKEDK